MSCSLEQDLLQARRLDAEDVSFSACMDSYRGHCNDSSPLTRMQSQLDQA